MTRRRWIADRWDERSAVLLDAQALHLARVLRAQPGQEYDIVAGGFVRRGVIDSVREDAVEFSLHEYLDSPEPAPFTLALSIIRFEPFEWAVEKLTELGVARIVPLIAQRSEKHLVHASAKRVERWRRIAREAAQQSRRANVPEIADPIAAAHYAASVAEGRKLLLSEQERDQLLLNWLDDTQPDETQPDDTGPADAASSSSQPIQMHAAIGPEGGWTNTELASFARHGWHPVTLGPRILRAETAAIALASVLGAWLEKNRETANP